MTLCELRIDNGGHTLDLELTMKASIPISTGSQQQFSIIESIPFKINLNMNYYNRFVITNANNIQALYEAPYSGVLGPSPPVKKGCFEH